MKVVFLGKVGKNTFPKRKKTDFLAFRKIEKPKKNKGCERGDSNPHGCATRS